MQLGNSIAAHGSRAFLDDYNQTALNLSSDAEVVKDLAESSTRLGSVRNQLITRIKAVLLETSYAAKG